MDRSFRSLSNVPDSFIDDLHGALLGVCENISPLEQATLAKRLPADDRSPPPDKNEQEKARLYFHLYTVPLLEAAGLMEESRLDDAVFWGAVQLCLGLHIRYADYLMDGDRVSLSLPQLTKQAHGYLARAQSLLWSRGHNWTPEQAAIYAQYIEYECEVEQGCFHDYNSLWRRVSPLCVVGESYLASHIRAAEFRWSYRNFLSWSLIHADCDDVMEDLAAGRKTPVTVLAGERMTGNSLDLAAAAEAIAHIKDFQAKQARRLLDAVTEKYPAWRMIIQRMAQVFT